MDTFDSIDLGVFASILLLLVARMTFWKQKGKLLGVWGAVPDILLLAIPCLNFLLWHHWNMPHRRHYQFILEASGLLICLWKLAQHLLQERRKAQEKQAQKAGRRYF